MDNKVPVADPVTGDRVTEAPPLMARVALATDVTDPKVILPAPVLGPPERLPVPLPVTAPNV